MPSTTKKSSGNSTNAPASPKSPAFNSKAISTSSTARPQSRLQPMGSVHLRQSRRRTDLRHRVRRKYLAAGGLPGCASEKGIEQGAASKTRGPAAKQEGVGGGHRLQGSLIFDHIARLKGTGGYAGGLVELVARAFERRQGNGGG